MKWYCFNPETSNDPLFSPNLPKQSNKKISKWKHKHLFKTYFPRATKKLTQISFEGSKLFQKGNGKHNKESESEGYDLENL